MLTRSTAAPIARGARVLRDASGTELGERQIHVIASNEDLGRDDIIVRTAGIDTGWYGTNGVILFNHDPAEPIASCVRTFVAGDALHAIIQFPEAGLSRKSDEIYNLTKAGVLNAVSMGFDAREVNPIKTEKRTIREVTSAELMEISVVSIPALPSALVVNRAHAALDRISRARPATFQGMSKRGLYEVGRLAYLLEELGWSKSCAEWEAEVEQDGSTVPAQLGEALKALGEVLIAMTVEEVAELVGPGTVEDVVVEPVDAEEAVIVEQARSPGIARFRLGVHRMQARKKRAAPSSSLMQRKRMARLYEIELAGTRR